MARLFSAPALTDFITRADGLIDRATPAEGEARPEQMDTPTGLHVEFSTVTSELATIYYLVISRNGAELHYSEAVKLAALFTDRAGLTHPVMVTEGEKPIFYCQWLIKPSEAKKYRKLMLAERVKNRKVTDPLAAMGLAIDRELNARASKPSH